MREVCDGLDDDCDDDIDEGFFIGVQCREGVGACGVWGQMVCSPDGLSSLCDAVPGAPGVELCGTSVDEDCDGSTDEGFPTGDPCSAGVGA